MIVLNIQRFSIHDGPGIRTTVFLKGCPLTCVWCHNPESWSPAPQLAFFGDKCTGCQKCAMVCPQQVHSFTGDLHTVASDRCILCGNCMEACPADALKIFGEAMTADQILETVKKDANYFLQTGGGITVSGGEPFFYFDSLIELLKKAKECGLHTCVETSGLAPKIHIAEAAPYVDIFLFDCKETSDTNHRQFTGVGNQQILENFSWLYETRSSMILRCPIIPGYNDNDRHLKAICRMEQEYPRLQGIEIMPYHNLGKSKAAAIFANYCVEGPTYTKEQKDALKERLSSFGATQKLISSF